MDHIGQLSQQGGGTDRLGKNAQCLAAIGFRRLEREIQRVPKIIDRLNRSTGRDRLCPVRVVEIENVGLRPHARRTEARRMGWVSLDFCGTPFVTCYQ